MRLYLADDEGLLVASGSGDAWRAERRLDGTSPQCVAVDPSRPERVWCGTFGDGVFSSIDGGDTWAASDLEAQQVTAVAVDADGRVYVGTEPSALYRSDDGGASWTECHGLRQLPSAPTWSFPPRPHTSHVRWITPDPTLPGRLFVCIEAGALVHSDDGGDTWHDRRPDGPYDTHTLVAHPSVPGHLCSAAGDGYGQPGRGFSVSLDAGETWHRPDDGLHDHYLWGLAADPVDPDVLVVSAARGPREAHGGGGAAESTVYRRVGEAPWEECLEGLPPRRGTNAAVIASSAAERRTFYAASNRGVYRSTDDAASWEPLALAGPSIAGRAHALVVVA